MNDTLISHYKLFMEKEIKLIVIVMRMAVMIEVWTIMTIMIAITMMKRINVVIKQ